MPCSWYTGVNDTGISGFSLLEEMGGWGESLHQPKIYLLPPTPSPLPPSKLNFFFLLGLSFTDTNDSGDSRVRERTISYSTLPLPLAHKHSDIYLQLCMWDDYHMFLIAPLVLNRLLLDDILLPYRITISYRITIWLIDDVKLIFVCLLGDLVLEFCYSNLDTGNRWPQTRID